MKRAISISLLTAAAVLAAASTSAAWVQGPTRQTPKLPSFQLRDLNDQLQTLEGLKGNKATLVNFFFPACSGCNVEIPHLSKLHETYRERGFSLISINILPDQNPMLGEWAGSRGLNHPILQGVPGLSRRFRVESTPTNYLIDSSTRLVKRYVGYRPGQEDRMESEILKLLGEETSRTSGSSSR